MRIAAKAFRPSVLAAGSLFVLLAVQSMLAAEYGSYAAGSSHDAVARRLDPPPSVRQLEREDEFERRGLRDGGRVDRNVQRAGHSEPIYADQYADSYGEDYADDYADAYGDGYGPEPHERISRRSDSKWSPDRKGASRRPSYFDGLYRRREEMRYGMAADFESEYDSRPANFQEELPPGRNPQFEAHPVYEGESFGGEGSFSDEYYGPGEHYGSGEHYSSGERYGPGGWKQRSGKVPYGGYSDGPPPWYFIPPGNWHWWDDFTIFGGVHGFKGPLDQGRNGNFGFHEGLNWGGPLWDYMQIGYQLGGQVSHSNFHGDQVYTPSDDGRTQYFLTAGLFHRAEVSGVQCGIVVDWLQDDYHGQLNLTQIRSEISYLTKSQNEFGVWAATNTDEAEPSPELLAATNLPTSLRSTDMLNGFWRTRFGRRGEGRLWGGATSDGYVVFGGEIRVPLSKRFAIESSFNYLSADGEQGRYDNTAESWSTVFNLVWYPGWTACKSEKHVYRPLFNVANNSTFTIDPNQTDGNRFEAD